jgi:esterase/lipase superfamily enzyme
VEYLHPLTPRRIDGWISPILDQPMPIVRYGDRGRPLLLFPTAAADFLENERFFLVGAVEPFIAAGRLQLFSIDSINRQAWMDKSLPVPEQARRQALYAQYVEEEVVPYIRAQVGGDVRVGVSGASFGAYHAANMLFRRPDLFDVVVAMSGFYDLAPDYLGGYTDDNCYFNNPAWYVPGLEGPLLDVLQTSCTIRIMTGQGAYESPEASYTLSSILSSKHVPHVLDVWGDDVNHDWPWWRQMLPYALDKSGF